MFDSDEFSEEPDHDEFDIEAFRSAVISRWTYLSKGNISNWAIHKRDDNVWQIGAAPVFQECYGGTDDGKRVWSAFEFDILDFLAEPELIVEECRAMSYEEATNTRPFIAFVGSYRGQPFVFQLNLEPIPNTEPLEILDTIQDEVRPVNGEST
jgi:hypothetical protein